MKKLRHCLLSAFAGSLVTATAGCYDSAAAGSAHNTPQPVALTSDAALAAPRDTGVYEAHGDPNCCWLAQDAVLHITVGPAATKLRIVIAVPGFAAVRHSTRALTVLVNGQQSVKFTNLRFGSNSLVVPLHAKSATGIATVELKPSFSFVPKDEHINSDTRRLSVILKSIRAE